MRLSLAAALAALTLPASAQEAEFGTLNPEELTMGSIVDRIRRGETSMTSCAAGYMMTKSGNHGIARETFELCSERGYTQAMTWMGYLDSNGFGGGYDPDRAAEWDRRAAEAGDHVGMLNYGLDLLRGHGVAQDEATGRALVDRAAEAGSEMARALQAADYDPRAVTPDADEWRYAPMF